MHVWSTEAADDVLQFFTFAHPAALMRSDKFASDEDFTDMQAGPNNATKAATRLTHHTWSNDDRIVAASGKYIVLLYVIEIQVLKLPVYMCT